MINEKSKFLSLYPTSRCVGHVTLEWPATFIDCGTFCVRPLCNAKLLKGIKKSIQYFEPAILIIRDYDTATFKGKRAKYLIDEVERYANEINTPIYKYSRQQVRDVFEQFGAKTKYEIVQKLLVWYPELAWRVPKARKAWEDENPNMAVFDALALTVTHKYLTE